MAKFTQGFLSVQLKVKSPDQTLTPDSEHLQHSESCTSYSKSEKIRCGLSAFQSQRRRRGFYECQSQWRWCGLCAWQFLRRCLLVTCKGRRVFCACRSQWKRCGLCAFDSQWRRCDFYECQPQWGRCGLCACQFQRRYLLVTLKEAWPIYLRPSEEGRGVVFHKAFFFFIKIKPFSPYLICPSLTFKTWGANFSHLKVPSNIYYLTVCWKTLNLDGDVISEVEFPWHPCVFVWASEGRSYITVFSAEVAALSIREKLSIPSSPQIQSLSNSLINKQQLQTHQAAFQLLHISSHQGLNLVSWDI